MLSTVIFLEIIEPRLIWSKKISKMELNYEEAFILNSLTF